MSESQKTELYYKALNTVLLKLQKHSASADSWRESRTYLMGYIAGILGDVQTEVKK